MITSRSSGVVAMTISLASLAVPGVAYAGESSQTSTAASCYAAADTPWYRSPSVYATGHIYCSPYADAYIKVTLTMDGAKVGSSSTRSNGGTPHLSDTAVANNRSGNQEWCTIVDGYYTDGGLDYPVHDSACESAGF